MNINSDFFIWHERFSGVMIQLEEEQIILDRIQDELNKQQEIVDNLTKEKSYITKELLKQKLND